MYSSELDQVITRNIDFGNCVTIHIQETESFGLMTLAEKSLHTASKYFKRFLHFFTYKLVVIYGNVKHYYITL